MADNKFSFERLEAYQVAREALALGVQHRACWSGLPGEIGPQIERALVSAVLNIAEGAGRWTPADQRRHYQIACGSITEVAAGLDIAALYGNVPAEVKEAFGSRLVRVSQMLRAMIRKR